MLQRAKGKARPTFITLSVVLGTLGYGYYWTIMNNSLQTMELVLQINNSFLEGVLVSMQIIGALFGSAYIYFTVQSMSRKLLFLITDISFIIGGLVSLNENYTTFLIARFFTGFALGIASVLCPLFLQETLPIEYYGFLSVLRMVWQDFSSGTLICNIWGLFFKDTDGLTKEDINPYYWRLYFIFGTFFIIIRIVMLQVCMGFDTPIYYLKQNNNKKLDEFLDYIYESKYKEQVKKELQQAVISRKNQQQKIFSIFEKKNARRFYLGALLNISHSLSGMDMVLQYSTTIFHYVTSVQIAEFYTLGFTVLKLLGYITVSYVCQKYGRRKPLLFGALTMSLMNFACAICISIVESNKYIGTTYRTYAEYLTIIFIYIYLIGFVYSFGGIKNSYTPEFLPESALSVVQFLNWFFSFITILIFPVIKETYGVSYQFLFFAIFVGLSFIYCVFEAKETMGLTETQILKLFYKRTKTSSLLEASISSSSQK